LCSVGDFAVAKFALVGLDKFTFGIAGCHLQDVVCSDLSRLCDLLQLRGGSSERAENFMFIPWDVKILDHSALGQYASIPILAELLLKGNPSNDEKIWLDLGSVLFVADSSLSRIDDWCFHSYMLRLICIPRSVAVLGASSFFDMKFASLTFEPNSQLTCIEESCFQKSSMRSIEIPRSVKCLGASCLLNSKLEIVQFEANSNLKRICGTCFGGCLFI
jgi:hypothetical protein